MACQSSSARRAADAPGLYIRRDSSSNGDQSTFEIPIARGHVFTHGLQFDDVENSMHKYDLIADWYATERQGPGGVPELESLIACLPHGASVLDVGCGNGIPLTRKLLSSGCRVVGVDSSPRMLERFEKNCPATPFICAQIQCADLAEQSFDAAVAWGVIFHLPHDEQRKAIARVASVLKPGGLFLFTAGDEDGDKEGDPMNGVPFHYWSFSIDGYRELLTANEMTLLDVHRDAGQNIYDLARSAARHVLVGEQRDLTPFQKTTFSAN